MEDDFKPAIQHQRRVNPKIHEVIKKEVVKLLDARLIYPISDSPWVSLVHCVPKKGGMTVVTNEDNKLIPTRFLGYFQISIDPQDQEKITFTCPYGTFAYRRMPFGLCNAPGTFQRYMMAIFHDMIKETMEVFMDDFLVFEDSFSSCLSHLDKMLKREKVDVIEKLLPPTPVKGIRSFLGHARFYRRFIQDFSEIARPMTHLLEKETPFIFSTEYREALETLMEVFMDDFSVFGDSFSSCLSHLDKMLKRCEDTNLVLNWEKCHFMVKEGIVLGHKILKSGIEVDREKVDVIAKLPPPTSVKGIRSFLGHAGFYRRFIQDFSKIARPMTHLLEKETPFIFSTECREAFETLKKKLTEALILVAPD
ncbi:reverse transcriptase domain-containing protein [Tanacetum coccineum]